MSTIDESNQVLPRRWYSVEETAEITTLGLTKVRELIRTGQLHALRVGRRIVVPIHAIDDFERNLPGVE